MIALEQFSKRMSKFVLIFWGIMRILNFVVISLKPDTGNALIQLQHGADDIAMTIVIAYNCNSLGEKIGTLIASGYFSRKRTALPASDNDDDEADSSSNG